MGWVPRVFPLKSRNRATVDLSSVYGHRLDIYCSFSAKKPNNTEIKRANNGTQSPSNQLTHVCGRWVCETGDNVVVKTAVTTFTVVFYFAWPSDTVIIGVCPSSLSQWTCSCPAVPVPLFSQSMPLTDSTDPFTELPFHSRNGGEPAVTGSSYWRLTENCMTAHTLWIHEDKLKGWWLIFFADFSSLSMRSWGGSYPNLTHTPVHTATLPASLAFVLCDVSNSLWGCSCWLIDPMHYWCLVNTVVLSERKSKVNKKRNALRLQYFLL